MHDYLGTRMDPTLMTDSFAPFPVQSTPPGTGRDVVIIGITPWYYDIGVNSKNIARELSKNHRVLYVNTPLDRNTLLAEKRRGHTGLSGRHSEFLRSGADNLVQITPGLWNLYPREVLESLNWIPSTRVFSRLNRINNRRFARDIRSGIERLGFGDFILFNDSDMFRGYYLKELLRPSLYVYYSRDNLLGVPYWRRHGRVLEPRLIAKSDLALANSVWLRDYLAKYNPRSHYVGQGCDLDLFNPDYSYPVPEALTTLPRPLIGYVGSIVSHRLDEEAIAVIARERPDWSVVMVGPEDPHFQSSDLHRFPNIHFLGKKPIIDLPAYMAAFDACINPQVLNEITVGNYPLKLDEYLAMGKPVVATRTDALRVFGEEVYAADKPEDYPNLLSKALSEDSTARRNARIALARSHSWEASVALMEKAFDQTLRRL